MKNLFSARKPQSSLGSLVNELQGVLNMRGSQYFVDSSIATKVVSMEGIDDVAESNLENSIGALDKLMRSNTLSKIGLESLTDSQIMAGQIGSVISSTVNNAVAFSTKAVPSVDETNRFVPARNGVDRLKEAMEAYDEKDNKNVAVYTVAYNMQASRQDEFGETLFPTVNVSPDSFGFTISIALTMVYDEVRRNISGSLDTFNKRNIIQAVRDPSILANNQTNIVPVYRTESQSNFVAAGLLTPYQTVVGKETVTTSALAFGKKFSLLGISQTAALIAEGLLDSTDSIDSDARLGALYLQLTNGTDSELVKFRTDGLQLTQFNSAPQGNYRLLQLNFSTKTLMINKNTKLADGSTSALLPANVIGNYTVRLAVEVSGSINQELGDTSLMVGDVSIDSVKDADGNVIALTSPTISTLVAAFAGAKMVGYDLVARRTNSNRRQRGLLMDVTRFNQIYGVPLLAPITIPRPMGQGDNTDTSDLQALITATRIQASLAAVDELLRTAETLRSFVNGADSVSDTTEMLGAGRWLVTPFFESHTKNVTELTSSVKSSDKDADIQASLVSLLRSVVYRMYRDSGYKAAADAMKGGQSKPPTVIIATDPVLQRWLLVNGDARLLGDEFDVKIVSTLNIKMIGKIYVTFGDFENLGTPNPLHFGNMAWKPELTLVLPLHRNGANSKELTVQPSFTHVTNLPVLAEFVITGIDELTSTKTELLVRNLP